MRQAAEGKSSCDVRAVISRWGEVGTLSGEAMEVDFLCLEPLALDFSHDGREASARTPGLFYLYKRSRPCHPALALN